MQYHECRCHVALCAAFFTLLSSLIDTLTPSSLQIHALCNGLEAACINNGRDSNASANMAFLLTLLRFASQVCCMTCTSNWIKIYFARSCTNEEATYVGEATAWSRTAFPDCSFESFETANLRQGQLCQCTSYAGSKGPTATLTSMNA